MNRRNMRSTQEHSRLKDLLTDTITLLCKNGLTYDEEFSVDALIGITLDQQEVVLFSIKEIIKNATTKEDSSEDADSDAINCLKQTIPQRKPRKRHKRNSSKEDPNIDFTKLSHSECASKDDTSDIAPSPIKRPCIVKSEQTIDEDHNGECLDLVIKEESDTKDENCLYLNRDFNSEVLKEEDQSNPVQSTVTVTPITGIFRKLPPSSVKNHAVDENTTPHITPNQNEDGRSAKATSNSVGEVNKRSRKTRKVCINLVNEEEHTANEDEEYNDTPSVTVTPITGIIRKPSVSAIKNQVLDRSTTSSNETGSPNPNLDDFLTGLAVPDPETGKYLCPICAGRFSERGNFKQHMQGAHGMGKKYTCVCNAQFSWKQSFNRHKTRCNIYNYYYSEMLQGTGTKVPL